MSAPFPVFRRLVLLGALTGAVSASAQITYLKADNQNALDQAASWSPSGVPTLADTVTWNGTYTNGAVGLGAGLSVEKVKILSPSTTIAINAGTGNLTLNATSGVGIDLSASTQNATVACPIVLGNSQTWTVTTNRTLTASGAIGDAGQARGLTIGGNGSVTLSGNNTYTGATIVNTGATLTVASTGLLNGNATVNISTANAAINLINSGTIKGTLNIASATSNGTATPASPNANEFALNATGLAQLKGNSTTGPITNNGQLTLSDSVAIKAIGTITGTGGLGGINDNNTAATGKTLVFTDGAALSYYKPANGANATLQVAGNASFSYFGYNSAANITYTTTFNGGNWTIGKLGRANSGAQFAGTANLNNGARVTVQTPGFEHGAWNVRNGALTFNGTVAEGQGPTTHNIGLNFTVDNSGGANSTLTAAGLTLGLGAANNATESNSLTVGNGGVANIKSANLTVGTATNHLASETNTVNLQAGGKLIVAGALQANATIGANQTRTFNWTGGQLSAGTIVAAAAFNGANSTLSAAGLNQTAGTLAPGDTGTAGKTAITGNYTLGANATLAVEIGGTTQATSFQTGQYDYLTVSGTTALTGNLSFNVISGFTPAANATFTILNSTGALSGTFANAPSGTRVLSANNLATFVVAKSGNAVTLGQYQAVVAPVISASLAPTSVFAGNSVTFSVTATSLAPVTYQWRKNGVAIDGATSATLSIVGAQGLDAGPYDVIVSNAAGSVTSATFNLSVTVPTFTQSIVVNAGATRQFDASASATSATWRLDGVTVGNGTSYTYAPDVNAVGTHWLQVKEAYAGGGSAQRNWGVRVRIVQPDSAIKLYVSPTGSDSASGAIGSPFRTLEKARDTLRAMGRPLAAGGATVYLRGGTHVRTTTFTLTTADSGTATAPVTYMSYPGETAVISGGKSVLASQFSALAASETSRVAPGVDATRIWEADLTALGITRKGPFPNTFNEWQFYNVLGSSTSAGIFELFYNGKRMYLSRYPNHDLTDDTLTTNLKMNGVAAGVVNPGTTLNTSGDSMSSLNYPGTYTDSSGNAVTVGGAFQYNATDAAHVARWQTALAKGGLWVVGYWRVPWQINGAKVGILDTGSKQTIGFASGVSISNGIGNKYARPAGNKTEPWWVVNLLEELDQPGEWCIDFSRNKVYFLMDVAGAPPDSSVVLSDLSTAMVQITGSYVNLQGLTFQYGLAQGVQVLGGSRNLITGCTFRNIGNYAVDLNNFSGGNFNGVVSCNMSELASGGVLSRGGNNTATPRVPTSNFVVNNRIKDYARVVRVYAASVDLGFQYGKPSVGSRVAHNTVSGSPHVGMLWKDYDHTIEYNDIGDYCQFSDDMGGIYNFSSNYVSNTVIRYNYVHDSDHGDGIYFDSDHINATVYGNTVNLKTLTSEPRGYGFFDQVPGGTPAAGVPLTDNSFNNISVSARYGFQFYSDKGGVIESNLAYNNIAAAFKWNQVAVGNGTYTNTSSTSASLASGPNVAYAVDPGFLDFANDDLRLRPDSAAYTDMPKFEALPLEMAGVYNDELRSDAKVYSPFITTDVASGVGANTATFNGNLVYPQFDPNATVRLYWGTADGGTDPAAWQNVVDLGTPGSGNVNANLSALTPNTQYFFRFYATNSAGEMWAEQTNSTTTGSLTNAPLGGTATASSGTIPAADAFDGDPATKWQSGAGQTTGFLQYQFANGAAVVVTQYQITSAPDTPARDPKDWQFLGSNDGLNWTTLDTQTGQVFTTRGQIRTYGFSNTQAFKFYQLNVTANNGDLTGLQIGDLRLLTPVAAVDTTGPVIFTPGDFTVQSPSPSGIVVDFTVTAVDAVSGNAKVTVSPASGSVFPLGATKVNVSTLDAAGNPSNASFTITVVATPLPSPWTIQNVGGYNTAGTTSSNLAGSSFTMNATGGTTGTTGDIWSGTSEGFTYVSQPWTGDGIFTARISNFTISGTDTAAKAGIMFRETFTAGAKNSITYLTKAGDAYTQHKTTTAGTATNTKSAGKTLPYWLRLVRKGNNFSGFISPDGVTWTQLGNTTANAMNGNALSVGLAVAPRTATNTANVTFDNVSFLGIPAAPTGVAATAGVGQVALSWSAVPTATSYTVDRSDVSGGPYSTIASGLTNPAYTDTGLSPGATSYYLVSATNAVGEGPASTELAAAPFTSIQAWRQENWGSPLATGNSTDTADPDGDGRVNLLEYAFGGNPLAADQVDPTVASDAQGYAQITFKCLRADLTYVVRGSNDLATWTDLATYQSASGPIVTFTDPIGGPKRFLQVNAFLTP